MPFATVGIVLAAVVLGVILGAWLGSRLAQSERRAEKAQAEAALQATQAQITTLRIENAEKSATLAKLDQESRALLVENARLQQQVEAEKAALETAKKSLSETFGNLAADALSRNNTAFLHLAKEKLEGQQQEASNTLETKKTAIENLLKPVATTLEKLEKQTQEIETKREGAYQAVLTGIKNMQDANEGLRRGTTQLIEALRKPQVRGNWGQEQLRRCIEFAGMVEHVSFDVEVFVRGEESSLRPDCIIRLPNHRTIVIDVKTPLESLLNAASAENEAERAIHLTAHAKRVKEHLSELASKAYYRQFKESPDFVVCFLPSEASFSAALEQDPNLIEFGSAANVILATPTTLIALLKAVAYGWEQLEITRNAEAIRDAARALYDKLTTAHEYFSQLGKALTNAVSKYNALIGCVEGRGSIFTQARKMHELGIGKEELDEHSTLETSTRSLIAEDWKPVEQHPLELAAAAEAESTPGDE